MPRIIWFAIGAACGVAAASTMIHAEQLDRAPGALPELPRAKASHKPNPIDALRTRLASLIEGQADRLSGELHDRAVAIASQLRPAPSASSIPQMPVAPYVQPATTFAPMADVGLEATR